MAEEIGAVYASLGAVGLPQWSEGFREAGRNVRALKDELSTTKASTTPANEGLERTHRGVRQLSDEVGVATRRISPFEGALRGAQPTVTGLMKALELAGAKGAPAVQGLTNALVGVVSNGFTPLGLALGAGGALIAAWTAHQERATKSTERQTRALEQQRREQERLQKLFEDAATKGRNLAFDPTGIGVAGEVELEERAAINRGLMPMHRDAIAAGEARLEYLVANSSRENVGERIELVRDLAAMRLELARMEREVSQVEAQLAILRSNAGVTGSIQYREFDAAWQKWSKQKTEKEELEARQWAWARRFWDEGAPIEEEMWRPWEATTPDLPSDAADRESAFLGRLDEEWKRKQQALIDENEAAEIFRDQDRERQRALEEFDEPPPRWTPDERRRIKDWEADSLRASERLLEATRDAEFQVEQIHRDGTERAIAEYQERYAGVLAEARKYGHDVTELEAAIEAQVAEIRRRDTFEGGLAAGVRDLEEGLLTAGDAASELVLTVGDGLGDALVAAGTKADDFGEKLKHIDNALQDLLLRMAAHGLIRLGVQWGGSLFGGEDAPPATDSGYVGESSAVTEGGYSNWGAQKRATGAGGERGIGNVYVQHDPNARAETQRRRRSDGYDDVIVTVKQAIADDIDQGGVVGRAVSRNTGTNRPTVSR